MGNQNYENDFGYRLESEQARENEASSWLRAYFRKNREDAEKFLNDSAAKYGIVYDRYGDMYNTYGEPAKTGFGEYYAPELAGYRELQGGMSPLEKQQFEARSVAPVRGIWDAWRMGQERRKAATGGIGPGWTESARSGMRNAGFQAGDVALGAQTAISAENARRKEAGLAGAFGIQSKTTDNRFQGMSGQMGALAGQSGAAAGLAGIGSRFAEMSDSDLKAFLQNKQISNDMIARLLQLRQQEPTAWQRFAEFYGQYLGFLDKVGGMSSSAYAGGQ